MKCKICGTEVKIGRRFCQNCGCMAEKVEAVNRLAKPTKKEKRKIIRNLILVIAIIGALSGLRGRKYRDNFDDFGINQDEEIEYDITEGGIHSYQCVLDDCSWEEAQQKCLEWGGHLVRINTPEEYEYILSFIEESGYEDIIFRLGGRRDSDSTEYYWVDENNQCYGEALNDSEYWSALQWKSGEPNFYDGEIEETCVEMYYNPDEGSWVWNDIPNDLISIAPYYSGRIGFIVEYD